MNNSQTTSRRSFIKLAAASTVAASASQHILAAEPSSQDRPISANDKIRIATIGIGDRASAIAQLRRHEPAVITMDLGLPPAPDDPSEGMLLLPERPPEAATEREAA